MKRNMAEKLTASVLAAVLTFGMMAPQTAMTAEAAAKSTLEKDVQKLVKKSKAKKEKTSHHISIPCLKEHIVSWRVRSHIFFQAEINAVLFCYPFKRLDLEEGDRL